jgi:hypothetical protein
MMCVVVGFGISVPIPDHNFYGWCALVEIFVAASSILLRTPSSAPIFGISLLLCIFHYLGYKLNGYPVESPYHFVVKIAEHAELIACAVFSKPFLGRPKTCRQNKFHIG